jgi:hypothetical protein
MRSSASRDAWRLPEAFGDEGQSTRGEDAACNVQCAGMTRDFVTTLDRYSSTQALNRWGVPQRQTGRQSDG